jgi:hypothetical protein
MMPFDIDQITLTTLGLIQEKQRNDRSNDVLGSCFSKGGAEGWVQGELERVYSSHQDVNWVLREHQIYTNTSQRVDFLVQPLGQGACVCIELKVESLFQSAGSGPTGQGQGRQDKPHQFFQGVREDIEKLSRGRREEYTHAEAYAVAIVFSEEAAAGMDRFLLSEPNIWRFGERNVRHGTNPLPEMNEYRFTVYVVRVPFVDPMDVG